MTIEEIISYAIRENTEGILVTDSKGGILYADEKASHVHQSAKRWAVACPPPKAEQKREVWDLPSPVDDKTYMVITSTLVEDGSMYQVHLIVESSLYTSLYRDINDYSRMLREERDHEALTGLYNKGKLLELKQTLFNSMDSIAVYSMDINNLKITNDTLGHEAGDRLIIKAAESLHRVEARNIMGFRVGGDEFTLVALHVTSQDADALLERWQTALDALNLEPDGIKCVIACGIAHGEEGYDIDQLMALADQRMYEDKRSKKQGRDFSER